MRGFVPSPNQDNMSILIGREFARPAFTGGVDKLLKFAKLLTTDMITISITDQSH